MSFNIRLKEKWGIETESQYWRIMLLFTLTGTSCMFVREPVFDLLGITDQSDPLLWWTAWFIVIFPSYQVLLLVWSKILGVFPFALWFVQKMLRAMGLYRKPENGPPKLS